MVPAMTARGAGELKGRDNFLEASEQLSNVIVLYSQNFKR